jgi:hypothetical protein
LAPEFTAATTALYAPSRLESFFNVEELFIKRTRLLMYGDVKLKAIFFTKIGKIAHNAQVVDVCMHL